jgi:hypothetical protein
MNLIIKVALASQPLTPLLAAKLEFPTLQRRMFLRRRAIDRNGEMGCVGLRPPPQARGYVRMRAALQISLDILNQPADRSRVDADQENPATAGRRTEKTKIAIPCRFVVNRLY